MNDILKKQMEITRQINEKSRRVAEIGKLLETADPIEAAELKTERKALRGEIVALDEMLHKASYIAKGPSSMDKMLAGITSKFEEKKIRIAEIDSKIKKFNERLEQISKERAAADKTLDTDKAVALAREKETIDDRLKALREMREKTENAIPVTKTFLEEQWYSICSARKEEWDNRLERIRIAVEEYKTAIGSLDTMNSELNVVRDRIKGIATDTGFSIRTEPFFTVGIIPENYSISNADGHFIGRISSNAMSCAL